MAGMALSGSTTLAFSTMCRRRPSFLPCSLARANYVFKIAEWMKNPIQWLRFASRPVIIPFRRLGSTLNDQECKSVRAETECGGASSRRPSVVKCERKCFKYPELRELAKPSIFPVFPWLARSLALQRKIAAALVANNSISSEESSFVNSLLGGGATHVLGQ